ncbi:hypothetical protein Lal_00038007 [Lupinus albus]|nr:hypothetical protein Lal_00038007 [Lupinus albus]
MSIINPQSKELSGLVEIKVAIPASHSLLRHNDPFYALKEQIARLAKFAGRGITPTTYTNLSWMTESGFMFPEFLKNQGLQCKNGVYQTMVKNIFIVQDEDLLVDVGGLGRFDHPYGYFEEKLLSAFEPVRAYRNMLRDSQRHQATSKPIVTALAVEYRLFISPRILARARDSRLGDGGSPGRVKSWTILEDSRLSESCLAWARNGILRLLEEIVEETGKVTHKLNPNTRRGPGSLFQSGFAPNAAVEGVQGMEGTNMKADGVATSKSNSPKNFEPQRRAKAFFPKEQKPSFPPVGTRRYTSYGPRTHANAGGSRINSPSWCSKCNRKHHGRV